MVDLDFTAQEPLPERAVRRVQELLGSGKLFRYGEGGAEEMDAALLEEEFASLVGRRFCVAFNSCGASLAAALIAVGVERDDQVLMNAFTLAPVPGAIAHAGAQPAFVDITADYHIDLEDLRRRQASTGAQWLLLSYMRGHIPDLDNVMAVCAELGLTVIEDCAHTMGGHWDGRPTGSFGIAGCFSTQTFKHVNSGNEVFERHRLDTPILSMRMSALTAALARPQLGLLAERAAVWNTRYAQLAERLRQIDGVRVPDRDQREQFVASSIQFNVDHPDIAAFVQRAQSSGVALKWFGAEQPNGFTSRFDHWRYAPEQSVPRAASVLSTMLDMRIPLTMTSSQAEQIVDVIARSLTSTGTAQSQRKNHNAGPPAAKA